MTPPDLSDQERSLRRVLWLLRDYLPDLVVIGGWVPYLYRRYGGLAWVGRQSRTAEVDVLTMPPLPVRDGLPLDDTLRAAGLSPDRETGPAAVWEAASASGEQIEFLTPLKGTTLQHGSTVAVPDHGRLGAIMLPGLELLAKHRVTLAVPVGEFERHFREVTVNVPRLGAYTVNKGATVLARKPYATGPNPKQAKDVVYLHDLMAAGADVRRRVEADVRDLWVGARRISTERRLIRSATENIALLAEGQIGLVALAGDELATRDGLGQIEATARIRGQLTDLADILRDVQTRR